MTIPEGVTSIGSWAFRDCSSLTSLAIPSSVTSIGSYAFYGCSNLTSITVDPANPSYAGVDEVLFNKSLTTLIQASGAISGAYSIPSSVTSIGDSAFDYCTRLTSVTIPEGVTSIGSWAFRDCSSLTSVAIPSSVTSIGNNAFYDCSNLTSITVDPANPSYASVDGVLFDKSLTTLIQAPGAISGAYSIPSSVTSIGSFAFYGCSSLTSVTIPEGVTSIGSSAFSNCSSLTSVTIPSSVTSIGDFAFQDCSSLTSVTIPEGVTSIGSSAFSGCHNLTSINIPASVTSIGSLAFRDCRSLTSVTIPEGVTSIGYRAFYGCSSLTSVTIPEGVTSIGSSAFYGCHNLTSINIPASVTSIGSLAFRDCRSLTSVTIPEGVTSIGSLAFYGCSSLISINIPASVTSIGNSAFQSCNNLSSFNVDPANPNYASVEGVLYNKLLTELIQAPGALSGSHTIPLSITSLPDRAFQGCRYLTSINIPAGVTSIGSWAFSGCSSLQTISLPAGITSIAAGTFSGCSSITSISIPAGVTSIGSSAFSGCSSLTAIVIPSGVTEIGSNAFLDCSALESISLPLGLTSIADRAFRGCTALVDITIPPGVTSIGKNAFEDCSSLLAINLPDSVTRLGDGAFSNCLSLRTIDIGSGLSAISFGTFYNLPSLTSFTVSPANSFFSSRDDILFNKDQTTLVKAPEQLTGEYEVPNSVTHIERDAFRNSVNLSGITLPDSVISIGSYAFNGCSSLRFINIGSGLSEIGFSSTFHLPQLSAFSVDTNNTHFASIDGILFDKSLTTLIQAPPALAGHYTIPESVSTIGRYAFYKCTKLTGLSFPPSITSIQGYAFEGCTGLTQINLPSGLTTIEGGTFRGCTSLIQIDIPSGVTSIQSHAFSGCRSLRSIVIPDTVTSLGFMSFYQCYSLESVSLSSNLTTIESSTFSSCESLKNIVIPEGVTYIGSSAFSRCTDLVNINIPAGVTYIGNWAFYHCFKLDHVSIPQGVTYIGASAFEGCPELRAIDVAPENPNFTSVNGVLFNKDLTVLIQAPGKITGTYTLPDSVVTIRDGAFFSCPNISAFEAAPTQPHFTTVDGMIFSKDLKQLIKVPGTVTGQISIANGVEAIGLGAFAFANQLTAIHLPASIRTISGLAFFHCINLESISVDPANSRYSSSQGVLFDNNGNTILAAPPNLVDGYVIPEDVTHILSHAFSFSRNLTSIEFPSRLDNLGSLAFWKSPQLKRAVFTGDAPKSMNPMVFVSTHPDFTIYFNKDAIGFTSPSWYDYPSQSIETAPSFITWEVVDGNAIITDCDEAVSGEIVIPQNFDGFPVTRIGPEAFRNCRDLETITLPEGLISIEERAFQSCSGLNTIVLPDSLVSIGDWAFLSCSLLNSITIPASVTSIGWDVFSRCQSLSNIIVDPSNPSYASVDGVLFNKFLTQLIRTPQEISGSYVIPASVTSIGSLAFSDCTSLTSVTLPAGLRSIGYLAFWDCINLSSITIPSGVTFIGEQAFRECTSLSSINIPASVTFLGDWVFYRCSGLTSITVDPANPSYASVEGVLFDKSLTILIQAPGTISGAYSIPSSVTSIGSSAFEACRSLTSITIPSSVTFIGAQAFWDCNSLTSARFEGNAPVSFGSSVFEYVASSFTIEYPATASGWSTPTWNGYPAVPYSASGFASWASNAGLTGTDAEMLADPDKDGISNLMEYAFGLSPTSANLMSDKPSGSYEMVLGKPSLVITHRRSKSHPVSFSYKTSSNLAGAVSTWATASVTPVVVNPDVDGDGEVELVSVAVPLNGASRAFMVLEVTE